jgi:hypothetical protein
MKALPLTLDFNEDINYYPLDTIRTIKGEPYSNIIQIRCDQLLFSINSPLTAQHHLPQIHLDDRFLQKISFSIR